MGASDARDGNPMKGALPLLLQRDTAANEDPLGYSATHPVVDLIALLKGCDSLIPLSASRLSHSSSQTMTIIGDPQRVYPR